MPVSLPVGTPRITTGNVRTTYDPFTPSPGPTSPGPTPAPFNGLACPLGSIFRDLGGSDSVSGTLIQLPQGVGAIYKYVLYKSASNPALVASPAVVYYTDETSTVVSGASADALPTAASAAAGILMPNTTDLATLTAAILNNNGNGSGVWMCIGGFVKNAAVAAGAAGSIQVGSGNFALAALAAFAAGTINFARQLTAVAGGLADLFVLPTSEV